ncbi:MAG: alpha/beta fold hydrolase [Betaproteobacteria bacterium]|nr:alpha/beta fold hydrolase [Betaproteobacteria bacterium]
MLAHALRFLLAAEMALYAFVALRYFSATLPGAALAALGGVLWARVWIVATTYVFAWIWHSPSTRLSVGRALWMGLAEYAAFIVNFVLISPFERLWMGADHLEPAGERPPVLLIHGYGCSRGAWWWLRRRLERAGWQVATINLEPIYTSIDNTLEPLARRIDAVLAETGAAQLILVGHSMGGLVARAYLHRFGAERVARLVTLGTPHGGSRLAHIAIGRNGRQMEPGSDWLQALPRPVVAPETVVIYSPHDNYVMPQANLRLEGASHRPVDAVGHLAMLFSPRVAGELRAALEKPIVSSAGWKLRKA